jgi:single-strand DNA-binding protein
MLNRVELIGRLTRDPELDYTPGGTAVCRLQLETSELVTGRDGQRQERVEQHEVVAWRKLAEMCSKHLTRGRLVQVEGRLHSETWEDQRSGRQRRTEVVAQRMRFLARPDGTPLTAAEEMARLRPEVSPGTPDAPAEGGTTPPTAGVEASAWRLPRTRSSSMHRECATSLAVPRWPRPHLTLVR